jgi:hypothetical protein
MAEPLRVADAAGLRTGVGNRLDEEVAERHDTILAHMLWDEKNSEAWEQLASKGAHRLVFDIDDVMWEPDWQPFRNHYTPDVLARVWRNVGLAHVVTTPSEVIAEYVSQFNPNVQVVPNTVPEYLTRLQPTRRPGGIVGYQGSSSHETDLSPLFLAGLGNFLRDHPKWQFHLWGKRKHEIALWPTAVDHVVPWQDSLRAYYMSLNMDIGLGPLARTPFNAGKSALRAIEYAALGIVAVLSDEPPYREWVERGVTGILVSPRQSWFRALDQLARDTGWRESMSTEARRRALDWTTEACIMKWVNAWNSA